MSRELVSALKPQIVEREAPFAHARMGTEGVSAAAASEQRLGRVLFSAAQELALLQTKSPTRSTVMECVVV
jgi:hypothetical protein